MTSVETTEPGPRRQWGWIFVALLFIELVVAGPIAWSLSGQIQNLRGYLNASSSAADKWVTQIEIDARTKQLNRLYLGAGISLSITLICAVIGLRRHRPPSA